MMAGRRAKRRPPAAAWHACAATVAFLPLRGRILGAVVTSPKLWPAKATCQAHPEVTRPTWGAHHHRPVGRTLRISGGVAFGTVSCRGLPELTDAELLMKVQNDLLPSFSAYLPLGCVTAVSAALRHRWQHMEASERPLLPRVLQQLASLRAGASDLVAAALSAGSLSSFGNGAGLTRQQVQAAFGKKTMWHLVELQQFASIEGVLRKAAAKVQFEERGIAASDVGCWPRLSPGQVDLGLSLFTAQQSQSGSSESLILFLAHKAAALRQSVARPRQRSGRDFELMLSASMATDLFSPLADLLGLGKIKDELEDAAFALTHEQDRDQLNAALKSEVGDNLLYLAGVELQEALEPEVTCRLGGPAGVSPGLAMTCELERFDSLDLLFIQPRFSGLKSLRATGRTKTAYSTWKKMQKKGLRFEEILDRTAMRIILDAETLDQAERLCYVVRDLLVDIWTTVEHREKDYIANPKANGYRSIHLAVERDGQPFEVQIRTEKMHKQAEYGSCGHWEYKVGSAVEPTDAAQRVGAEMFGDMDVDGSGYIDEAELRQALAQVGVTASKEDAEAMLAVFDVDQDGTVTFQDFWRALVTTWFPVISGTHRPRPRSLPNTAEASSRTR